MESPSDQNCHYAQLIFLFACVKLEAGDSWGRVALGLYGSCPYGTLQFSSNGISTPWRVHTALPSLSSTSVVGRALTG